MIVVGEPVIGELEEKLVLEALRSGRLVQGPMIDAFETAVRDVVGTRHALAVNSGTSALIAALIANGIGPGDEVDHEPVHLRRHAERDPVRRRDTALRRSW